MHHRQNITRLAAIAFAGLTALVLAPHAVLGHVPATGVVLAESVMEGALRGAVIGGAIGAVVGVVMWAMKKNKPK